MSDQTKKIGILAMVLSLLTAGLLQVESVQAQGQGQGQGQGKAPAIQLPNQGSSKNPQQQLQQVQTQLKQIQKKLEGPRKAAMKKEKVKKAREAFREALKEYNDALRKEMIKIAPEKEKQINRRFTLYDDLMAIQRGDEEKPPKKEQDAMVKEFRKLQKSLGKVQRQAQSKAQPKKGSAKKGEGSGNPLSSLRQEVQKKQKAAQQTLIAAMKKEGDNVAALIKQFRSLQKKAQSLQFQIRMQKRQRQQGQGGGPAPTQPK